MVRSYFCNLSVGELDDTLSLLHEALLNSSVALTSLLGSSEVAVRGLLKFLLRVFICCSIILFHLFDF